MFKVFDTLNPRIRGHFRPNGVKRVRFFAGGEGEGAGEFDLTPIPDTYKDNPNVSKYKTVGELIKGHSEVVKLVGSKGVIVPKDDAPAEEWAKFHVSLGTPEKADGYKFAPIENLHPEIKITPEEESGFKAIMHKNGIPQKAAQGIFNEYYGMLSQALTKRDEQLGVSRKEAETKLRNEWGKDFDKNLLVAKRLVEKFGDKGARDAFGDLGNNPAVLRFLSGLGTKLSEDSFHGIGGIDLSVDASGAKAKIKAVLGDKSHPYHNNGPGHAEAVAEMTRLYQVAHPDGGE